MRGQCSTDSATASGTKKWMGGKGLETDNILSPDLLNAYEMVRTNVKVYQSLPKESDICVGENHIL